MKCYSFVSTALIAASLLVYGTGCTRETKTTEGEGGKKLTLKGPSSTTIKAGETATINIGISREKFNEPVALTFNGLPDGVSIMESDRSISKDATSTKLTLKAANDAKPMDDHKVTVTATGGNLSESVDFKLTVNASDNAKKLTLSAPGNTTIKPGETATINVGISREKFNDPVALTFAGLPEGVTVMESDRTISKDATSAKLTLKATATAKPIEDHKVTVTASGGGLTQESNFNISVK
jgi:uncharacterized membrane protein